MGLQVYLLRQQEKYQVQIDLKLSGISGKIVVENEELTFYRLTQSEREFNATYTGGFGEPEFEKIEIPVKSENANHPIIIQNWIDSIRKGSPLLSPGEDGVKALEITNAMNLSSWIK